MVERVRLVNGGSRPCISPIEETVAPVSTKNRIRSPATERHKYGSFSFDHLSGRPYPLLCYILYSLLCLSGASPLSTDPSEPEYSEGLAPSKWNGSGARVPERPVALYSPLARNHIHHNTPVVARPVTVPCPFFLWLGVEALFRTAEEPSGIWGYTRRR